MTTELPPGLEVVRSPSRRRSSSASVRDGRVVVRVPAGLAPLDEADVVARLLARLRARASAPLPEVPWPDRVAPRPTRGPRDARGDAWLVARADDVADRHLDGVRASSVTWSHRMRSRWGSCTVGEGRIRISSRLADAPGPVLDDVLLHELAHLLVAGHGPAFRRLVARGPHAGDAAAWLRRRTQLEQRAALGIPDPV